MPGLLLFLHSQPVHTMVVHGLFGMYAWRKPLATTRKFNTCSGRIAFREKLVLLSVKDWCSTRSSTLTANCLGDLPARIALHANCTFYIVLFDASCALIMNLKIWTVWRKYIPLSPHVPWCLTIITFSLFYQATLYFTANLTRFKMKRKLLVQLEQALRKGFFVWSSTPFSALVKMHCILKLRVNVKLIFSRR